MWTSTLNPQQVDVSLKNPEKSRLNHNCKKSWMMALASSRIRREKSAFNRPCFVSIYPPKKLTNRHGTLSFFPGKYAQSGGFSMSICKVYRGVLFCSQGKSYWNRWQTPIDTWNMCGLSSAGISRDVARMTKHENRGNNGSEHVEFVGGIEEMSRYVLEVTNMTNTTILTLEMIEVVFCFLCFCS